MSSGKRFGVVTYVELAGNKEINEYSVYDHYLEVPYCSPTEDKATMLKLSKTLNHQYDEVLSKNQE